MVIFAVVRDFCNVYEIISLQLHVPQSPASTAAAAPGAGGHCQGLCLPRGARGEALQRGGSEGFLGFQWSCVHAGLGSCRASLQALQECDQGMFGPVWVMREEGRASAAIGCSEDGWFSR